jgi:glutamate racemase
MADARPIGMMDSGVGGLAILREVRQLLPHESIIYVADQGHLPYGPRPRDEIRQFTANIIRFLLDQDCKIIVIACNTANAAALHYVREQFPTLSIVGMEPAIKPAAEHTKTGVIGVIMTKATYQSELFASVVDRFANGIQVEGEACPGLVTLVEQGIPDTAETRKIVADYLQPLQAAGIDQLVIGCTHFTFLDKQFREQLGPGVDIVDPAPAVARQTGRVLEQLGVSAPVEAVGTVRYITSGDADHMRMLIEKLIEDKTANVSAAHWDGDTLKIAAPSR